MSLTRAEWLKMWDNIKKLEKRLEGELCLMGCSSCDDMRNVIEDTKKKIQQVIGQME
jgi:hypothetical protein